MDESTRDSGLQISLAVMSPMLNSDYRVVEQESRARLMANI